MDRQLPLRKLSPCDLIANDHRDFVPRRAFRFTSGSPRYFNSSPGVARGFCAACGSPLTYESSRIPDEIHLYAASLADPLNIRPARHVFVEEQLPWFDTADQLPRFAKTSRGGVQPVSFGREVSRVDDDNIAAHLGFELADTRQTAQYRRFRR